MCNLNDTACPHRSYKEHSLIEVIAQDIKYKSVDESEEELQRQKEDYHYDKLIEIAKKMLLKNKSIDEIIEFTGLSEEEIKKLQ